MESLKKIVQGCRQNYEKVILTVALVGLGWAVWELYKTSLEEEKINAEYIKDVETKAGKPVSPVDLTRNQAALKNASNAPSFNLAGGHYLFNPVIWQRKTDGSLLKVSTGKEIGPSVLVATNIRPLRLHIALDRVAASGTGPDLAVTGYHMVSTNEAALPPQSQRQTQFANINGTNRNALFILREIKGPPEAPTELIVELRDSGERVKVLPGQPFTRTIAYEADLLYPNSGTTYLRKRKDHIIKVAGDPYKIADITTDMVVVFDESNLKTYNVKLVPPP